MLPKGPWWPGLLSGCLGGLRALKKENYRVTYGFTDLRGKPAGRGRDGRGSLNQNVAGMACGPTGGSTVDDVGVSEGEALTFETSGIFLHVCHTSTTVSNSYEALALFFCEAFLAFWGHLLTIF